MTPVRIAGALAAAVLALSCGAALAGAGGTWTRVPDTGMSSIDEVAVVRTADGGARTPARPARRPRTSSAGS